MQFKKIWKTTALTLTAVALGAASFSAQAKTETVKLAYVEWDSCVAATNVTQAVLEQAGYQVKTVAVTGALMFQGLANNDVDAIVCAWLPTTHADYWAKTKDKLVDLGANMEKADLGLAVPDYVDFKTIPDLAKPAVAKSLNNKIIGIDPGAGLMRLTDEVIKKYKLPEKLVDGTDATMTAVLANAIRQKKPVVVTSWKPHWMWAKWKLRYLEDPQHVYGEPDHIDTIVSKAFAKKDPRATAILKEIRMDGAARGEVMVADRKDGSNPQANAKQWVKDHATEVDQWIAAAGKK